MKPDPKSPRAGDSDLDARIIDAARTAIAERGLGGAGLRVVADIAGVSVGAINYRIGDRAALLNAVTQREIDLIEMERQDWRTRIAQNDPVEAAMLPDLVAAWLDSGATARRISAIVTSELTLFACRHPGSLPLVPALLDGVERLWQALVAAAPGASHLASLVSSYCCDEQPFSILLRDNIEYRLLRASTIRALLRLRAPAPCAATSRWHLDLVERLAVPAAPAVELGAPPQGLKALIAEHIGDLLLSQGVGAVSHRLAAQAAGAPVSSVAHHFPTQSEVVLGGVEALYRRMRTELRGSLHDSPSGKVVIPLTHETALAALRNPAFIPFAIDMRRRRAENVHHSVAAMLGIDADTARDLSQAAVMALIGHRLRSQANDTRPLPPENFLSGPQ